MSKITVYPHENGNHWGWCWSGQAPQDWYERKKDAVNAAKRAARKQVQHQLDQYRKHVEPVFIEINYRGSSPPRTISIGEDDL